MGHNLQLLGHNLQHPHTRALLKGCYLLAVEANRHIDPGLANDIIPTGPNFVGMQLFWCGWWLWLCFYKWLGLWFGNGMSHNRRGLGLV